MQTEDPTANPANSPTCKIRKGVTSALVHFLTAKDAYIDKVSEGKLVRVLNYRSGVRGDGEGDEHHVEGDDDLDEQRVPVRPHGRRGSQHLDRVQHRLQHERRADRPRELRRPVERNLHTTHNIHMVKIQTN